MTREELLQLIAEVQRFRSELDDVEVKTAKGGTPKRLFEPLSAFSNRPDGGVILFGLDEEQDFKVVGVGDAQRLQEEISDLASAEMEPALRPEFTMEQIDGETVVAVEVAELPANQKPCYYRTAGLQSGSYIRVANTNRRMTDYEIFGYASARSQPVFDQEPVIDASLKDLDQGKLEGFVGELRRSRPYAAFLSGPLDQVMAHLRIVREVDGFLRPTLAGLLMFGSYPHQFAPQLVITLLQYYGTTETEPTLLASY